MWTPALPEGPGPLYLKIVDVLAEDVDRGRLAPGERLPTQRKLGRSLGVALGTVTRAYAEAERRGLVRGEVGRGTFVRDGSNGDRGKGEGAPSRRSSEVRAAITAETGPASTAPGFVDLSVNLPVYSEDPDLAAALRHLGERDDLGPLLHYQAHAGMPRHRRAGALWAARFGLDVDESAVLVTAGTQNALTVAFSTLAEPGDRVLTEALTYPGVKAVAGHLNLRLEGVAMDEEGLQPDALRAALDRGPARALYLIPTLHNPTSASLPEARRREIAEIATEHDLAIVEDDADRLLVDDAPPPLTRLVPERGYFIAGMSKAVSGGLRIAYLVAPPRRVERLSHELWATHWMVAPLMAEIAALWIDDGTADRVAARKRAEAAARQKLARDILRGLTVRAHPNGYHLWIELPEGWKSKELVDEALRRGVSVTPSETFLVGDGEAHREAPAGVRVSLGAATDRETLAGGLQVLAELLAAGPGMGAAIV